MSATGVARTARARSVGAVVRAAHRGLGFARAFECALLFAAALLLTRAAALASGLASAELGEAWGVAAFAGALCAAAWWCEHLASRQAVARVLDRRLAHDGALVTAYELEGRAAPTPMERLVEERVLARLQMRAAVRAVLPSFVVPLAAATVAALVLVFAEDARRAPAAGARDARALTEGLARALALGAPEAAGEAAGMEAESARLLEAVRQLDTGHANGSERSEAEGEEGRPSPEARRALAELDQRLAERAAQAPAASELRSSLVQARAWLDALRHSLAPEAGRADGVGSVGDSLAQAPLNGTISRPLPDPTPMSTSPVLPAEPAPALGLQAGTWWPREYDAVVARWLELSRARSER